VESVTSGSYRQWVERQYQGFARAVEGHHVAQHRQAAPQLPAHLAAAGETTWHAYASYALAQAAAAGAALKATADRIRAVPSTQFPAPARRPANSRLDTSKLRSTFDLVLPPWQDGVAAVVRELATPT
jgi:dTDP-4-dehydrorhamnose reductase